MNRQVALQRAAVRRFSRVELLWAAIILVLLSAAGCKPGDAEGRAAEDDVQREYRLRTALVDGQMAFVGAGGPIDGLVNPELAAVEGETLRIVLLSEDGMMHDLHIPDLQVKSAPLMGRNDEAEVVFTAGDAGSYSYYCTISGHRQAGMEGTLLVTKGS